MELYIVEIDKDNNDNWVLFGLFSTEEIAENKLKEKGITANCSSTTPIKVDDLV